MSDAEFYELLIQLMADIDTQFQFWLTMTFALVVTAFFAGPRLIAYLRAVLALLYVLAWLQRRPTRADCRPAAASR